MMLIRCNTDQVEVFEREMLEIGNVLQSIVSQTQYRESSQLIQSTNVSDLVSCD